MDKSIEQKQLNQTGKAAREVSFELLRIIAMCMVIALHYLSKGNVLVSFGEAEGMNSAAIAAWTVEALCLCAVNVYILISGYFGCKGHFRLSKIAHLWGTVFFYSVMITILLGVTGNIVLAGQQVSFSQLSVYDWMNVVFPVVTEEYWFMTAYLILYLFMPFLNAGMEKMEKKTFRNVLICLFVIFCVSKSVLPMQLPTDRKGYDVLWFVCLYLLGGYFRLYGCPVFRKAGRSLILYLLSVMATVGAALAARYLYLSRGMLADFVLTNYFYTYNHIFCLTAAIGLFGVFTKLSVRPGRCAGLICEISSCTLGVYLIHEQLYMRYLWPEWFQAGTHAGKWTFLPHMAGTVICVFLICALIEWIRKRVARLVFGKIGQKVVSSGE